MEATLTQPEPQRVGARRLGADVRRAPDRKDIGELTSSGLFILDLMV